MQAQSVNGSYFFVFAVAWLSLGIAGSMITDKRIGQPGLGFWLGLLLGPLGLLICFIVGSQKDKEKKLLTEGDRKKCPMCAELVQPEALVCKHCGHKFEKSAA